MKSGAHLCRSRARDRASGPRVRGFTLVEILLAIAISALLLVAANFFVLSMSELWGRGSEDRLFDQHVRGVTRFLESFLTQAVVPTTNPAPVGTGQVPHAGLSRRRPDYWRRAGTAGEYRVVLAAAHGADLDFLAQIGGGTPRRTAPSFSPPNSFRGKNTPGGGTSTNPTGGGGPPAAGGTSTSTGKGPLSTGATATDPGTVDTTTAARFSFDSPFGYDGVPPMLNFEVNEAPGVCVWPERPLPMVECALQVTADEGLVLLWKSKLEEDYGAARPRKTLISPFVQSISYEYYDAQRGAWSRVERPLVDTTSNALLVPQRIRLLFVYQTLKREVSIAVPADLNGPPLR